MTAENTTVRRFGNENTQLVNSTSTARVQGCLMGLGKASGVLRINIARAHAA